MEKIKSIIGKDSSAKVKEEVKEETEDEMETPTGTSFFSTSAPRTVVTPPPSSPHKEKIKDSPRGKQHSLKGAFRQRSSVPSKEAFTAWEKVRKKTPLRDGRRLRPPRFSRLLDRLSEEQLDPQEKSQTSMEPTKEKLEDLTSRPPSQEDLGDQDNGVPPLSVPQPQEMPAVETVETKPKEPEEEVPSTSRETGAPSVSSSQSSIELKSKTSSFAAFRRVAAVHSVHSKILDSQESVASLSDTGPSVWRMGQRISHWKTAHQRGYHIDQITQDKVLKNTIMKHERDTKAAVPLPLQEVMEEEVLAILAETLKAYQKQLGVNHFLTIELEEQAEKVHLRLKGRGVIN